ncbi:PREDICTED: leucine-rich repeat-containing protein 63 [Propithecus coquereli]|uniref:leucine-rich repeat-containing protein 63 n=1 Tax=Propithecus coquereli TaxID=379532 RepID=UPI00063F453F|nr:PREDICTED: leucine-rich repeat-containing protein 63 [Propithecus coquereli]
MAEDTSHNAVIRTNDYDNKKRVSFTARSDPFSTQFSQKLLKDRKDKTSCIKREREQNNYEKQHLFVKTQKHPQLLRRPLPPKFFKLSLCKKKIHTAKTGETKSPHVVFTQDETISIKRDKTSFPDVVSRNKSPIPVKIQNLCFDYHVQERMTTISTRPKSTKNVHWHIPDTATGSVFFPSCYSASTRVFGKETCQIKRSRKSKKMVKEVYTSKSLPHILILSSVFSKPLITSCEIIPPKLKKAYPKYQPLPKSPSYTYQHILTDFSEIVLSPLPSNASAKPESNRPDNLTQSSAWKLGVAQFPDGISLPTPVLPRKPHAQSIIETLVTENENIETAPKHITPKPTEGNTSQVVSRILLPYSGLETAQGEPISFAALQGFFILNCPDLTSLAFQLIYLNLSFNDLCYFPTEVFCLKNLQVLKLRNNPIKEIPSEIQQLKYLRIFSIAFNWINVLPPGLFRLSHLEDLDISYNEISFIPNEIQKLSTSKCEWCHGPKFGEGFRIIRSYDIFGVLQLPVMFHVCSSYCYRKVNESSFILSSTPDKTIALNLELTKE